MVLTFNGLITDTHAHMSEHAHAGTHTGALMSLHWWQVIVNAFPRRLKMCCDIFLCLQSYSLGIFKRCDVCKSSTHTPPASFNSRWTIHIIINNLECTYNQKPIIPKNPIQDLNPKTDPNPQTTINEQKMRKSVKNNPGKNIVCIMLNTHTFITLVHIPGEEWACGVDVVYWGSITADVELCDAAPAAAAPPAAPCVSEELALTDADSRSVWLLL